MKKNSKYACGDTVASGATTFIKMRPYMPAVLPLEFFLLALVILLGGLVSILGNSVQTICFGLILSILPLTIFILLNPAWIIYLLILAAPFYFPSLVLLPGSYKDVLIVFLMLLIPFHALRKGNRCGCSASFNFKGSVFLLLILGFFLIWNVITLLQHTPLIQDWWAFRDAVEFPLLFIVLILFFSHENLPDWFWRGILITGMIASSVGIIEYLVNISNPDLMAQVLTQAASVGHQRFTRSFSTLGFPTDFGHFCVMMISLAGAWLTYSGSVRQTFRKSFLGLALVLSLAGLFASFSRAAWFEGALVLSLFMFVKKQFKLLIIIFSIAAVAFMLTAGYISTQAPDLFSLKHASIEARLATWLSMKELFLQHPWFGSGFGYVGKNVHRFGKGEAVDSFYIMLLVNSGLIGGLTYLALLLALALITWLEWYYCQNMLQKGFLLGFLGFQLAMAFGGFFELIWYAYPLNLYFWFMAAVTVGLRIKRLSLREAECQLL